MKGKIVLVTGADGGLGIHVTRAFLDAGGTVVGASRNIRQSSFNSPNFTAIPAEISNAATAKALLDQLIARFGKLDVLVHTVGGFAGGQPVVDTDDATWQRMLDINLNSVFHVVRAAIEPGAGVGAYSASKAAMVSLIRTVALENKDAGLRANVILPGTMDTPANRKAMPNADFSKWVQPAAVASLITWLASPAGGDINGAAIPVYGKDL